MFYTDHFDFFSTSVCRDMRWMKRTVLFVIAIFSFSALKLMLVAQTPLGQDRDNLPDEGLVAPLGRHALEKGPGGGVTGPLEAVNQTVTSQPNQCSDVYRTLMGSPASCGAACQNITCSDLYHGTPNMPNSAPYTTVRQFMNKHPWKNLPDRAFINLTRDCDNFKQLKGYHMKPMSQEEGEYPLAFNILMHINLEQVERLLRAIYRPQNVYCIHIDAKAPKDLHDGLKALVRCFDNVFITSKLERIVYAGFSRLQADINCMHDLVKHPVRWQYLMNLAGLSYPLMTNGELVKLFKIYNGMNDIEGMARRVLRSRLDNEWSESSGVMNKTGKKNPPPPDDIEIVRGSAYGIFSRDFVQFILTDSKAQHLLEWSKMTYSPDEHYWATLHHTWKNPHIKAPGSYTGLCYTYCTNNRYHDI